MTANDLEILTGLNEHRRRLREAKAAFEKGEDISALLLSEEFEPIQTAANAAAASKIQEMIQSADRKITSLLPQYNEK